VTSLLLAASGVCLLPPVFHRFFSLAPPDGSGGLWLAAACLMALAFRAAWQRRATPAPILAVALGLLLPLDAELAFRAVALGTFSPATLKGMDSVDRALEQGRDRQAYKAHPFLHFKGSPEGGPFNALGFKGELLMYTKPAGKVRVACLGGSTTEFGYPQQLQLFLNQDTPNRFQVINFGISGWTSGHSLVNLMLNVVDFDPDYLVIHHGWNDQLICRGRCVRGDYYPRFKPWRFRQLGDMERLLTRVSYAYRALTLDRLHEWAEREPSDGPGEGRSCQEDLCQKGGAFYHMQRNLITMIHIARGRGITPVLATMPHSTRPPFGAQDRMGLFKQANTVIREVAAANSGEALLVDLDQQMTGKMQARFKDLAHLDAEGWRVKARAIGRALLAHRATAPPRTP